MQRERADEPRQPAGAREHTTLYRQLFAHLSDAILLADSTGRIVDANQAALTLLRYGRDELLRLPSQELLSARRGALAAARARLRQSQRWRGVLAARRSDGQRVRLDVQISVLHDGGAPLYALVMQPTGTIGQVAPLSVLRAALDQANDTVLITTAELDWPGPQIVYANAAFTAQTGYSLEEVLGRTPRMFQGPETDRAVLEQFRAALDRGQPFHGETINYRKDGSSYVLEWRVAPVRDASGTITHWVSIQRNISARKVEAVERERMYEAAQTALRARDELLTMVSHELKTPLTSLIGYSYLLQRVTPNDVPTSPRIQQAVKVISQQAQRLNVLVDGLLDLERLQTGTLTLRCQPLDLADLTRQVIDEFKPVLERHQLTLSTPEGAQMVEGDELRLRHALQHLIQNAISYSPEGGAIAVAIMPRPGQLCLSVSDHGIGIPALAREDVFQRFYRASNVNPSQISGFGIGLYVVREIVTRHGGSILLDSTEGQGSTFTICLPRSIG